MIYLDNAATTRPSQAVVEAAQAAMGEDFYNPSSIYKPAVELRKRVEQGRAFLKDLLQADQVIFTSGGTEANNLAILGSTERMRLGGRVLYSLGEHSSVKGACQALPQGFVAEGIPLGPDGRVNLAAFEGMLADDVRLVCVMLVNNETGAIQPIREVSALVRKLCPEAWLHVDGVQGFMRLPASLKDLGIDSFALSGHKIHGLKGSGALAINGQKPLAARLMGGGQEEGLRAGTENIPGIMGLMAAVRSFPRDHQMQALKLSLYEQLKAAIPELIVNGPAPDSPYAADHIMNLAFPPVQSETMLHALEGKGVYVSHGSACSSRKKAHSATLVAMGASVPAMEGALRFSLSPHTLQEEIDQAVKACVEAYQSLKMFTRR